MRRKKKKLSKLIIIENIFLVILAIFTIYMLCYALIKPDSFYEKLDNTVFNIFKVHIYGNIDTKVNSNNIIKKASDKDYSYSIYEIYYELLDDDSRNIYDDIKEAILKYEKEVSIPKDISPSKAADILHAILYDNPDIFWIDINFGIYEGSERKIIFEYKYDNITIINGKKVIDEKVNEIVSKASLLNTDYEKELYVHDTLANMVTYNKKLEDDQSIYSLFIDKEAVCTGYAKAFQLIMNKLGIPTYTITGYTTENHAWNLIELEDGFYNVDLASDDSTDTLLYKYFNINDNMISVDHVKDEISDMIQYTNGDKYINTYSSLYQKNK